MSFILEALRKSESDRQRLGSVALADLPVARRRSGQPWWVFALGALLVINLVVLAVVLTHDKTAGSAEANRSASAAPSNTVRSSTQVAPPVQPTATTPTLPNGNNSLEAATAQIKYEPVPAIEAEIAHAAASMPDGQTLVRATDAESKQPNPIPVTAIPETRGSPELHIDLHVYSNNARERFVLINMHRYTEGQQLPSGATVEQITPQGVIVYQNGSRYQINRQ